MFCFEVYFDIQMNYLHKYNKYENLRLISNCKTWRIVGKNGSLPTKVWVKVQYRTEEFFGNERFNFRDTHCPYLLSSHYRKINELWSVPWLLQGGRSHHNIFRSCRDDDDFSSRQRVHGGRGHQTDSLNTSLVFGSVRRQTFLLRGAWLPWESPCTSPSRSEARRRGRRWGRWRRAGRGRRTAREQTGIFDINVQLL